MPAKFQIACASGLGITTNFDEVRYFPIGGFPYLNTVDDYSEVKIYDTMTMENLYVRVLAYTMDVAYTVTSRVDGAPGNLQVSVDGTGEFEDTGVGDNLVSGNRVCFELDGTPATSGATTFQMIGCTLSHATATKCYYIDSGNESIPESVSQYFPVAGYLIGDQTTETTCQWTSRFAGTWDKLRCYVSANTHDNASTLTSRLNAGGTVTTLSVSITGDTTGEFEDAANSDTVAAGDEMDYQITTGSNPGTTSLTLKTIQSRFTPSDTVNEHQAYHCSRASASSLAANLLKYYTLFGDSDKEAITDANTQMKTRGLPAAGGTAKNLFMNVPTNTLDGDTIVSFQIAGTPTTLQIVVYAGISGIYEDNINTEAVANGDEINIEVDTDASASGAMNPQVLGIEISTVKVVAVGFPLFTNVRGRGGEGRRRMGFSRDLITQFEGS